MRTAFIQSLHALAAADSRIWLLTGDLGYSVLERFAQQYPDRYLNVGIAEQNMMGVAAGLALSGLTVFTYSIANFPTLRCLEQIRNDICYHHANVKIVAVGGGLAYGNLGATHHGTEELEIMRMLPGMVVFAPGDPLETARVTELAAQIDGPCYIRLGRAGEPVVHPQPMTFAAGECLPVRQGGDLTLVTTGAMLHNAMCAAEQLEAQAISCAVISVPTLKPFDPSLILASAAATRRVITIQEHSVVAGLGSLVAEALCDAQLTGVRFLRLGTPDAFPKRVGSQHYFHTLYGLSIDKICESAAQLCSSKS